MSNDGFIAIEGLMIPPYFAMRQEAESSPRITSLYMGRVLQQSLEGSEDFNLPTRGYTMLHFITTTLAQE